MNVEGYYRQKKNGAKQRGIPFHLSLEEYKQLIVDANITHHDIGNKAGDYVLGRKNELTGVVDVGPYEVGNCRFITKADNCVESWIDRKHTDATKVKMSESAKLRDPVTQERREQVSKQFKGVKNSIEHNERISASRMGMKFSDETKRRISASHNVVYVCPHCGKSGGRGLLRWHFNNCKHREES